MKGGELFDHLVVGLETIFRKLIEFPLHFIYLLREYTIDIKNSG